MPTPDDFCDVVGKITEYVQNQRIVSYNEGIDDERARWSEALKILKSITSSQTLESVCGWYDEIKAAKEFVAKL